MASAAMVIPGDFNIQFLWPPTSISPHGPFYSSLHQELREMKVINPALFKTARWAIEGRLFALLCSIYVPENRLAIELGSIDKHLLTETHAITHVINEVNTERCSELAEYFQNSEDFDRIYYRVASYVIGIFKILDKLTEKWETSDNHNCQSFDEYYQKMQAVFLQRNLDDVKSLYQLILGNLRILKQGAKLRFYKDGSILFEENNDVSRALKSKASSACKYFGLNQFPLVRDYGTDLRHLLIFNEFVNDFIDHFINEECVFNYAAILQQAISEALVGLKILKSKYGADSPQGDLLESVILSLSSKRNRLNDEAASSGGQFVLSAKINASLSKCQDCLDDKSKIRKLAFHLNHYFVYSQYGLTEFPYLKKLANVQNFNISLFVACIIVSHPDLKTPVEYCNKIEEICKSLLVRSHTQTKYLTALAQAKFFTFDEALYLLGKESNILRNIIKSLAGSIAKNRPTEDELIDNKPFRFTAARWADEESFIESVFEDEADIRKKLFLEKFKKGRSLLTPGELEPPKVSFLSSFRDLRAAIMEDSITKNP